jgi:hypothetical protein
MTRRIEPGPEREAFNFVREVRSAFGFLHALSFATTVESATFVRYEAASVFVNVFHGRGSYELGVEIGHRVDVDGQFVDEKFGLGDLVALSDAVEETDFRTYATTDPARLPEFLARLAEWTRYYGRAALTGEPAVFELLRAAGLDRSVATQDASRATQLRATADAAWRAREYARVIDSYNEMISELRTVELRQSELARLRFAEDHRAP